MTDLNFMYRKYFGTVDQQSPNLGIDFLLIFTNRVERFGPYSINRATNRKPGNKNKVIFCLPGLVHHQIGMMNAEQRVFAGNIDDIIKPEKCGSIRQSLENINRIS